MAALIALVLIWFLFLRPVIQSTAQERTDAALAQAGIPPPANPGQRSRNGSGGQPTPTPARRAQTNPPAGADADARARPGSRPLATAGCRSNGDADHAHRRATLYITDLVFSNPNGSTGALRLRRSGQDLMVLRLENFRDLDFHFVSPIVVGPGTAAAAGL